MIDGFRNEYSFLSNFYSAPVTYNGLTYRNSEAAFQAQKNILRSKEFVNLNPSEAKQLGRKVYLRSDWERVKNQLMYEICYNKFTQNATLKDKLLATCEQELVETNSWNDTYWGVCNGRGQNHLGKILMKLRNDLK